MLEDARSQCGSLRQLRLVSFTRQVLEISMQQSTRHPKQMPTSAGSSKYIFLLFSFCVVLFLFSLLLIHALVLSDPGIESSVLAGHEDSVWGLTYSTAHHRLASCSADGTVRIWDPQNSTPCLSVFNKERGEKLTFSLSVFQLYFASGHHTCVQQGQLAKLLCKCN